MTNHRDPIEDWLGQDVEVLPPPPGAFQHVRRRARRRKAIQAVSAAAGVAVIVAAGISIPALAGNLFSGSGPARIRTTGPTATGRVTSPPPTASPRPTAPASTRPGLSGPALSTAGAGPLPPAGFRPESVTFVGNHGSFLGAVLGQAPCGGHTCTAMAGTATYGSRWTRIGAPPAGPSAVSQVRFADPRNGWAYGPALYATHNGGVSWHAIHTPGTVADLAAVGDRAFAVVVRGHAACGAASARGCVRFALYSAVATSDSWTAVAGASGAGRYVDGGGLQLAAQAGYLVAGGRLYAGQVAGGAWHQVPARGAGAPSCLTSPAAGVARLLAPGQSTLYLACGAAAGTHKLTLYASGDSGRTWRVLGHGPVPAWTATSLTVSPAGHLVLAAGTGLYFSGSGTTWRQVSGSASGVAFRYAGMTTSRLGVAVPAIGAATGLYVTSDGGRTWQPRTISP